MNQVMEMTDNKIFLDNMIKSRVSIICNAINL